MRHAPRIACMLTHSGLRPQVVGGAPRSLGIAVKGWATGRTGSAAPYKGHPNAIVVCRYYPPGERAEAGFAELLAVAWL